MAAIVMTRLARALSLLLIVALAMPAGTAAQQGAAAGQPFKPEEIEQLVAPIALHPDPLVAQILMASTYPLEVVQAARFLKDNAALKGDALNEALKKQTWDDSVKSLVSFPPVLTMMNEKLDWTQKLGDAFLAQQKDVMDAVQRLRQKAYAGGNLKTTAEQKVIVEPAPAPQTVVVQQPAPTIIKIEPANPQVIYVPTYNPTVVYGVWAYPAYPPYPPYYPPGYVAGTALLSFGVGMAVGAAVWGDCDWHGGHADVNINQYNNYTKNVNNTQIAQQRAQTLPAGGAQGGRGQWQHNPENRRGVQYRDPATQQRFNRAQNPQQVQSREQFRGRAEQGRQELGQGPQGGGPGQGAQTGQLGAGGDRGGQFGQGGGSRGDGGRGGGAFEGMGQGGSVTKASRDRGQASRQGGGRAAAGGGGRGGGRGR